MSDSKDVTMSIQVIALCHFSGVTPRLLEALLQHFGNLERIMRADSGSLMTIEQMTAETANRITGASTKYVEARKFLDQMESREINVVTRFDDDFPQLFFELNNPPPILYCRGKLPDRARKIAAVSGGAEASAEGIELTAKLTKGLVAQGVQIVSSLSAGIGTAAHLACNSSGGNSFCFLESGFDSIHLPEHKSLAIDIVQNGGLLSEYPPAAKVPAKSFVEVNRLIAGISQAVVITELRKDVKRTMDLLKCCNDIGKLVFFLIDPALGAFAEEKTLNQAVSYGAIPMVGLDMIDDIAKALV